MKIRKIIMKNYLFFLILITSAVLAQNTAKEIEGLNKYADSVDILIKSSGGVPGEISVNSVKTSRNERAIGLQETKISFYYFQKEDSVYESENNTYFLPVYSDPLLITAEYNIAASQTVVVYYYLNGKNCLYRFISSGGYGYTNRLFWFKDQEILQFKERTSVIGNKETIQTEKFSKEIYSDGILVLDNLKQYLELYYKIFKVSELDK